MELTKEIIEKWNLGGIADTIIKSYKEKTWPVVVNLDPSPIAEAMLEAGLGIDNFYLITNDIKTVNNWKERGVPDERIFIGLAGDKLYDKLYEIGALREEVYQSLKNPTQVATNNIETTSCADASSDVSTMEKQE